MRQPRPTQHRSVNRINRDGGLSGLGGLQRETPRPGNAARAPTSSACSRVSNRQRAQPSGDQVSGVFDLHEAAAAR